MPVGPNLEVARHVSSDGNDDRANYREAKPGVLITEIQLRGMTGMELFEKLSADKHDLPVAFISGHADAPTAIQGMQAGAIDFLTKPVQGNLLIAVVARAYASYYDVDGDGFHQRRAGH